MEIENKTKETPARRASRLKYRSKPGVKEMFRESGRKYREKNRAIIRAKYRAKYSKLASNDDVTKETLVLGPYKEPLKKVEKGFGYEGALTFNVLGQVQCHICGDLFDNLAGHVNSAHKINAASYREKFQLSKSTKLISERFREEKKNNHLKYLMTLSAEQRAEHRRRALQRMAEVNQMFREGRLKVTGDKSLEHKNKLGTCPDQLLDIIRRAYEHYGHVPSRREFERLFGYRYYEPIRMTYGSWSMAITRAGYKYEKKRGGAPMGVPRKRYTDEELLESLSIFYTVHGRVPTAGDCNRGFLPGYECYRNRFGGFPAARRAAQVPDYAPGPNSTRDAYLRTKV